MIVRSFLFLCTALICGSLCGQTTCRSGKSGHRPGTDRCGNALAPVDILHQRITLDLTMGNVIAGQCAIKAVPREDDIDRIVLDLKVLQVDSIIQPTGPMVFSHQGEALEVLFGASLGVADTLEFTVYYRGDPVVDGSGFGGFYTSPSLIYNLGVAFQDVPHSYGRTWFPCLDNFTERSTYEFLIKTAGNKRAWCNGTLIERIQLGGDTVISHWSLEHTIPAYLVSVAAANFVVARTAYESISGTSVPVELIANASDTTGMKNSFLHLHDAFDHFEERFGPYRWERVGYVLTPVGAMEHATSIHYPRDIATGSLTYEATMAHELAHHWFGNLITCDRAEEMYINEGFAEYMSYLFLEHVHGRARYMNEVRRNHRSMVHRAHLLDDGWWALNNVPQDHTYGEHSYNKGADVLHSLRGYLGDEAFNAGLTSFLGTYAFQPVNTSDLRDHLSQATGMDLTDFFADWIEQPGWAAFEVDSFSVNTTPLPGGMYATQIHIEQKQRGPSSPYHNVPMIVTCRDGTGNEWTAAQPVLVGGVNSSVEVTPPFIPVAIILNADERISQAVTVDRDTLDGPGTTVHTTADLRITVNSITGSVPIRIEEYWVAADQEVQDAFAYVVSPDRWWRIHGNIPNDADISARINYDGRTLASSSYDVGLMQDFGGLAFHEDSLVLLYRPDGRSPWRLHSDFIVTTFTIQTDKLGRIDFNGFRAGDYTMAWRKSPVGIPENDRAIEWSIRPNPANAIAQVTTRSVSTTGKLLVLDAAGREVLTVPYNGTSAELGLHGMSAGTYTVIFDARNGRRSSVGKLVVSE